MPAAIVRRFAVPGTLPMEHQEDTGLRCPAEAQNQASGGQRDLPSRQRTLTATLDWSYELLGEDDRRAFAWLGIFVGGFRLEAGAAVLGL